MGVLAVFEYFSEFCPKKKAGTGSSDFGGGGICRNKNTKPQVQKHKKELISKTERGCDNTEGSSFKELPNSVNASVNCQS